MSSKNKIFKLSDLMGTQNFIIKDVLDLSNQEDGNVLFIGSSRRNS